MKPRAGSRSPSTALLVALAAFALFPLLWMLVGLVHAAGRGEHVSAAAAAARSRRSRTTASCSRAPAWAATSLNSLLARDARSRCCRSRFNVAAGYAFAKLRFAGRERLFQTLLGALVIPAQVAMMPLFLLLKWLGLVNSYGGVIVPALASVFGIFLVRQYALLDSRRAARSRAHRRRERVAHLPRRSCCRC